MISEIIVIRQCFLKFELFFKTVSTARPTARRSVAISGEDDLIIIARIDKDFSWQQSLVHQKS